MHPLPNPYGFTDETPIGPRTLSGLFWPEAAAVIAADNLGHALRAHHARKALAIHQRRRQMMTSKTKLPPGAPRKRAPKCPRLPKVIAPDDFRSILKAQGFTVASGVAYGIALLRLQGRGTHVVISAATNSPAHKLIAGVHLAARKEGCRPRLHLTLCPITCGLMVRWLEDDEPKAPQYRSRFGLDEMTACGELVDVPLSMFPPQMHPTVRVRVLHLDHVLSRCGFRKRAQVDVLREDGDTHGRLTVVLKAKGHDLTQAARVVDPRPEYTGPQPVAVPVPVHAPEATAAERQEAERLAIINAPLRNVSASHDDYNHPDFLALLPDI